MKGIVAILALAAVAFSPCLPAQQAAQPKRQTEVKVSVQLLPLKEQEEFLNSLVKKDKDGKVWAVVHPYILAVQTVEEDRRTVCSGGSTARTPQSGPDSGTVWYGNSSMACRDLASYGTSALLRFPDPTQPNVAHDVIVACHGQHKVNQAALAIATYGIGNIFARSKWCIMQESGQYGGMSLERKKHGQFDVLVATVDKVGGKPKLSRFDVVEVRLATLIRP